jgi:hypothetical protein
VRLYKFEVVFEEEQAGPGKADQPASSIAFEEKSLHWGLFSEQRVLNHLSKCP